MLIIECEQNTPEWFDAKRGKVSGSRIADVTARSNSGPSASRANYAQELAIERVTGITSDKAVKTDAMAWGHEQEDNARRRYEFETANTCTRVGLVLHPRIENACVSPDRLVNDDGLLEIKCPNSATHYQTLRHGKIDSAYVKQMQWQMACTGRQWTDYVSFDPRVPLAFQLHVQRVKRDPVFIAELEADVRKFLLEVDEIAAFYSSNRDAA